MKTRDFLGNEWDINCMGCEISNISMPVPGGFLQKTKYFCVHQDPLIPLPGSLVIASLRHIRSITEMGETEFEEFSKLLRITHNAIKQATRIEYLTLVQEENSVHFHLWLFPWTKAIMEKYGTPSIAKIRDIMDEYRKQLINELEWKHLQASVEDIKKYLLAG